MKLIDDVVAGERTLALVAVHDDAADPPGFDDLYEIGTAAVVHKMIKVPDGTLRILVQGTERIRLEENGPGGAVPGRPLRAASRTCWRRRPRPRR